MYKIIDEEIINVTSVGDVLQIDKLTFPAVADADTGDYINIYAKDGTHYAVFLDLTGADADPTGAKFVAADYSGKADVSALTTAIQVAAAVETELNTLTDFTAKITTDDTAADGTMLLTQVAAGIATNPEPSNEDDSGAGNILSELITVGYDQPDFVSATQDIRNLYGYAAQVTWTSTTAAATVKVQESNNGQNWVDISGKSQGILNNNGTTLIECLGRMTKYMRIEVTYTSGIVTTLKVDFVAKG
jgi:hypothetical protein